MANSTITRERPAHSLETPESTRRGQITAMILAAVGLIAVLVAGSFMVLGGGDATPTTGPAVVLGDRDAAFKSAAERYQHYLQQQAQAPVKPLDQQPPATDKEEAFRQAAERYQAQQQAGR